MMRVLVVEGEGGTMVYCSGCGALAGVSSRCACWDYLNFVSTTVPVVCSGCGQVPGEPTRCKAWDYHNFKPVPKARS